MATILPDGGYGGGFGPGGEASYAQYDHSSAPTPPAAPSTPTYPAFQAPSTPVPQYQAPDMGPNQYDTAFQASLTQARSSVQAQLRNALAEIGRQEGVASQQVGMLPGQYSSLYDLATQQTQAAGARADTAQAGAGIESYAPASASLAPIYGAMAMQQAVQQSGVPLLQLGVHDLAGRQRAGAEQVGAASLDQLSSEKRSYDTSQSGALRQQQGENARAAYQGQLAQYNAAQEQARFGYQTQVDQFKNSQDQSNRQDDYTNQYVGRQQEFQNQAALQLQAQSARFNPGLQGPFGNEEVSQERGANEAQENPQLRKDSAYTKLLAELRKHPPKDQADLFKKVDRFTKKNKKASTAAVSVALFDLYGVPRAAPLKAQDPGS